MGLLSGGIAGVFAKAFAGIYLPATLHKATLVYDDGGSAHATYDTFSCRAQVDSATEAMRQTPGYTERTVRVLVLKDTLAVAPSTDDTLETGGNSYRVMSVTTDPANSYWEMAAERA